MIHQLNDKVNSDGSLTLKAEIFLNATVAAQLANAKPVVTDVQVRGEQLTFTITLGPANKDAKPVPTATNTVPPDVHPHIAADPQIVAANKVAKDEEAKSQTQLAAEHQADVDKQTAIAAGH